MSTEGEFSNVHKQPRIAQIEEGYVQLHGWLAMDNGRYIGITEGSRDFYWNDEPTAFGAKNWKVAGALPRPVYRIVDVR